MSLLVEHNDKFLSVGLLILMSLTLRIILELFGQRWITTTAHTTTLVVLPIITYVITNVISGNIALSLGMVGSLSIVRFRNPVRSPLELSVYFCSITMGIAASVSLLWLLFLVGSMFVASITLVLLNIFYRMILKKELFSTSFSEGNTLSTLEVTVTDEFDFLDNNKLLKNKSFLENNISYIFASNKFSDLEVILNEIKNSKKIKNYQLKK